MFLFIFYITQLTPRTLSPEHKNSPGAEGAGEWAEDQRMRRRSKPARRRYQDLVSKVHCAPK